jgi:hypothetical protein
MYAVMDQPSLTAYCQWIEAAQPELVGIVRSRPYQMPKGYIPWQRLSAIIAVNMGLVREGHKAWAQQDVATNITAFKIAQWFLQDAPLYCLSVELLRAFEQADLSNLYELFEGFETSLPTFMVALPENALQTSEKTTISFICVHIANEAHPELSEAEGYGLKIPYLQHDGKKNVHMSSIDSGCNTWVSGLTVNDRGGLYDSGRILSAQGMSDSDLSDANRMKKIGLQCLLALAYSPELLDGPSNSSPAGKVTRRHQPRSAQIRQPRWLRSAPNAEPVRRAPQGGSHASPRPHWRSAHERRVPVGKRELGDRKLVKIAPTWVNPDH